GQYVGVAPTAIAHLRPGVEVEGLATVVDVAVDRGRAAERLATRRVDATPAGPGPYLLLVGPVDALHVEGLDEAGRQMDVGMPVPGPRFEHTHGGVRVFAQPVGEPAAGRACANDHVIKSVHLASNRLSAACR